VWIQVISAWIAGSFGAVAVLAAVAAHRHAASAKAAASLLVRGKQSAESQLGSVQEQLSDLQTAVEQLLNREKMRRVRQGAKVTGEPDAHTDPAAWKAYMRRQRALGGS
jgi:TolA-binding protein